MWRILQYNLLFSSNSDHSIQKQAKNNGYDAFGLNFRIFNIYLLCIKQN